MGLNKTPIDIQNLKLRLAESAIEILKYDKARILLNDILLNDARNVSALIDLGVINALEKKYPEAVKIFDEVLSIDPENEIARDNIEYLKEESMIPQ